jgi:hypothetical protein
MPTRDELHGLVDSLHDGAFFTAYRLLSSLQTWPPPPPPAMPPDLESFRANYSQHEKERLEELGRELGRRGIGGFIVGRNFDPRRGMIRERYSLGRRYCGCYHASALQGSILYSNRAYSDR